ncbi:MAG: PhoH family protein [Planctomycetes bacterium]|nr:PhoH family protein [Planctomycetota bacterium]
MLKTFSIDDIREAQVLYGPRDMNLKRIREHCQVKIAARAGVLRIEGTKEEVEQATKILGRLQQSFRRFGHLRDTDIEGAFGNDTQEEGGPVHADGSPRIHLMGHHAPKTKGQWRYFEMMEENDVTFSIGPAGTGKTFLAVLKAIEYLKAGRVRKIVLTRPVVEAGERLGFLPGDIDKKVNPYLRPLYDALGIVLDRVALKKYSDLDIIEIAPLAYMRGRTHSEAFVILDEGQNTTTSQMKMFLTRLGPGSKIVVTGDVTQIDLPPEMKSGLVDAIEILEGVPNIAVSRLGKEDIVRHKIVADIIAAYESRSLHTRRGEH